MEVDSLRSRLATVREMPERLERLLEAGGGLRVGRALHRFHSGLANVGNGLLPRLAPKRVAGKGLGLLSQAIAVQPLDGVDDSRVRALRRSKRRFWYATS